MPEPTDTDALAQHAKANVERTLWEVSDLAKLILTHYRSDVRPEESAVQFAIRKLTPELNDGGEA